jgi:putative endonuclease
MAWVYILKCSDGPYYTGSAVELEKRIAEHMAGTFDGYTSKRLPVELVFAYEMPTIFEAFFKGKADKRVGKEKKRGIDKRRVG